MTNKLATVFAVAFSIFQITQAQETELKNSVRISGTIENFELDSLTIGHRWDDQFVDKIAVDKKGNFEYALETSPEYFILFDGINMIELHLKNGDNLKLNYNANRSDWSIDIEGEGKERNDYLAEFQKLQDNFSFVDETLALSSKNFELIIELAEKRLNDKLNVVDQSDNLFITEQTERYQELLNSIKEEYAANEYIKANLAKGKPSPVFNNYENISGGTSSLSDFKGKYVYIDFWATWCAPCIAEIPYLKKLEKEYHNKNIAFVSISIDEPRFKESVDEMVAN